MKDERGFTLIEVLVTLGVMSIVMVIAFSYLIHVMNISSRAINDVQTENDARLALRSIAEDIRAAQPDTISFTGPSGTCPSVPTAGTCISFTVLRDTATYPGCESVITYGLLSGAVKETRHDDSCPQNITLSGKKVITNVVNGSTDLFSYFDRQGNPITSGQASAGSIGVTLMLSYQKNTPTLTLTSYASLRNAR